MTLRSELDDRDWKNNLDQNRSIDGSFRSKDGTKEVYYTEYKPPQWARGQWKEGGKKGVKPIVLPPSEAMTLGGFPATVMYPILGSEGTASQSPTKIYVSRLRCVDAGLQKLLEESVADFIPQHQSFFSIHGAPANRTEPVSQTTKASENGLDVAGRPLSDIHEIFNDMAKKASDLGLGDRVPSKPLRIFTMCSGTEAPLLGMRLMQQASEELGKKPIIYEHVGSAEIKPFKQAFIQRNYQPPVIFQDVTEFRNDCQPHTAYGGSHEQPRDVDILVAGFVCKDYSSLNKEMKKFGQYGKSYNTFTGIAAYANRHRPKIIILENVALAPWWQVRNYLGAMGYEGLALQVDTKDFYLPQSRQRGYMVAFDTERLPSDRFDIEMALGQWRTLMEKLQRRATSPFSDFLLSDNDPYLWAAMLDPPTSKAKKDQPWDACRHRYAKWRVEKQIGTLRPMTKWRDNGSCVFPDYGWAAWSKRQRERIWDTLDIEYLRHASERGYDMTYKQRWLELSQNVDHGGGDPLQWGIAGCVTPRGIPYSTLRGGPVVGKELLALQGIPVQDLDLNGETVGQLQDLAGNAMSTPVVAAAIFSAIMAAQYGMLVPNRCFFTGEWRDLEIGTTEKKQWRDLTRSDVKVAKLSKSKAMETSDLQSRVKDFCSQEHVLTTTQTCDISTGAILQMASSTMRLCECESIPSMMPGTFKLCTSCGHTACTVCSGNAQHEYCDISSKVTNKRASPKDFIETLWRALPTALQLCEAAEIVTALEPRLQAAARRACESPVTLRQFKRSRSWKIIYEGPAAILELHFVRVWKPVMSKNIDFFGKNAIDCYWLLFAKLDPEVSAEEAKFMKDLLKQPFARMKPCNSLLQGQWQTQQYSAIQLSITVLPGREWAPTWEAKSGLTNPRYRDREIPKTKVVSVLGLPSLTRSVKTVASALQGEYTLLPLCGGASGSLHVRQQGLSPLFFYKDPEQLQNASFDRYVFATTHHRLAHNEARPILARLDQEWEPPFRRGKIDQNGTGVPTESTVKTLVCTWNTHQRPSLAAFIPAKLMWMLVPPTLEPFTSEDLHCTNGSRPLMLLRIPLLEDELKAWRGFEYAIPLIGEMTALQQFGWVIKRAVSQLPGLGKWHEVGDSQIAAQCYSGCAPKAPEIKYLKPAKGAKGRSQREEVTEANIYEQMLHTRPAAVSAVMHCQSECAILNVTLNILTILHRLMGKLHLARAIEPFHVAVRWRISKIDVHENLPTFKQKPLKNNEGEIALPPPSILSRKLWPEQEQAVAWMVDQETKPSRWYEQEREEICVPGLGLRLDMEANLRKTVRGGVLADEVGGGKTTTSAALIAHMHDKSLRRQEDDFAISLKATLILVPQNLLQQWQTELHLCYKPTTWPSILVIQDLGTLMSTELELLKRQHIILAPWNLFDDPEYWLTLAKMCRAYNMPAEAGRAFQQWLREVLKDTRHLVKTTGRNTAHPAWKSQIMPENKRYDDFAGIASRGPRKAAKRSGFNPLFHLFSFERLIVDEYSYLQGFSFLAVLELKALSKWMLSGTPPLTKFDAINTTARLIGTQLTSEDEKEGCFSFVTQGKKLKHFKTQAEEFQAYQERHSAAWTRAQYDRAIDFADHFIRKNSPDRFGRGPPSISHHLTPLTAKEQIIYFEVYQYLMSQGVTFDRSYTSKDLKAMLRRQRLGASIAMSSGPEDALLSCCSDMRQSLQDCASVIHPKEKDIRLSLEGLYKALKAVFGYTNTRTIDEDPEQENSHFLSYKLRAYNMGFGDESTTALVDMLLQAAVQHPELPMEPFALCLERKKGAVKISHTNLYQKTIEPRQPGLGKKETDSELKIRKSEMKSRAEDLNTRTTRLVDEVRSLRFFNMVLTALEGRGMPPCSAASCVGTDEAEDIFIIGTCGHVACRSCLESVDRLHNNADGCIAPHCHAAALPHHRILASQFNADSLSRESIHGSKISAVVTQVQEIISIPTEKGDEEDKILIFVQLPRVAEALIEALQEHSDITYTDAVSPESSGTSVPFCGPVEEFRRGNGTRVCVLLLDSADAAGWNLQCANHIVFVSALVVKSQSRYNAIMKQAIGRCDRFKQKKQVHVYHFLMSKTVEVNIWKKREGTRGSVIGVEHEGPGLEGAACGAGAADVDRSGDEADGSEDDLEKDDEDDEETEGDEESDEEVEDE